MGEILEVDKRNPLLSIRQCFLTPNTQLLKSPSLSVKSQTCWKDIEDIRQSNEILFKVLVGKRESQKYKGKENKQQVSWSLFPSVSFKTEILNVLINLFPFS